MAYAEQRGNYWRGRWRGPDGRLATSPGELRFTGREEAVRYARDQEAAIRADRYEDPRAGSITVLAWVNEWFPALDLELSTLDNYRRFIEVHILPTFGDRELRSLNAEEIGIWEKSLNLSRKTAGEARSTFTNLLNDAIPQHLKLNPAARRRGKGKRGQQRIAAMERAEKVWASPLQALLVAERAAVLSGDETDFVMNLFMAYTGARWSEALGLPPEAVGQDAIKLHWKLYELNSRFYRGRPKAGSVRTAEIPPFLSELLAAHLEARGRRTCPCRNEEAPWCPGGTYVFLSATGAHFRRSNYSDRVFRPAADGRYPGRAGKRPRPAKRVLVDAAGLWPGTPLPPWPMAEPGVPFVPPTGPGRVRVLSDPGRGRCSSCLRHLQLKLDGTLINHPAGDQPCPGSLLKPAEDLSPMSWVPILDGLTPHGLRHGHETWLDAAKVPYMLISDRMGHEVSGMRGTYSHVPPALRAELVAVLEDLWQAALKERAQLSRRSAVPALDALLRAV